MAVSIIDLGSVAEAPSIEQLADAAMASQEIESWVKSVHPDVAQHCTPEKIRENPPVVVCYEFCRLVGRWNDWDALMRAVPKGSGEFLCIRQIDANEPWHPFRTTVVLLDGHPRKNRQDRRQRLKTALGRGFGKLVARAVKQRRKAFVEGLTGGEKAAIRERLGIDCVKFWTLCKGKEDWAGPPRPASLFDLADDTESEGDDDGDFEGETDGDEISEES